MIISLLYILLQIYLYKQSVIIKFYEQLEINNRLYVKKQIVQNNKALQHISSSLKSAKSKFFENVSITNKKKKIILFIPFR